MATNAGMARLGAAGADDAARVGSATRVTDTAGSGVGGANSFGASTNLASDFEVALKSKAGTFDEALKRTDSADEFVTYRRVQGGNDGDKISKFRIEIQSDGTIKINNKNEALSVSVDNGEHSQYFLTKRKGAEIYEFDVPKWFDDMLQKYTISQKNYRSNPLNQGGTAPKMTDEMTPGRSYELPAPWIEWLEEYGRNGRILKGQ